MTARALYVEVFGAAMRECRTERGRSQEQVAAVLGITHATYSRLETGKAVPNLVQLRRVAVELGVGLEDLLAVTEEAKRVLEKAGVLVLEEAPYAVPRGASPKAEVHQIRAAVILAFTRVKYAKLQAHKAKHHAAEHAHVTVRNK